MISKLINWMRIIWRKVWGYTAVKVYVIGSAVSAVVGFIMPLFLGFLVWLASSECGLLCDMAVFVRWLFLVCCQCALLAFIVWSVGFLVWSLYYAIKAARIAKKA